MESVNRVARRSNEPGLRRVSQDLNLVRNSIKLARASMGSTGACVCVCVVQRVLGGRAAVRIRPPALLWELHFLGGALGFVECCAWAAAAQGSQQYAGMRDLEYLTALL